MQPGRPSKLTPEIIDQVSQLAAEGLPLGLIADAIDVGLRTCQTWIKDGEHAPDDDLKAQFRRAIFKAEADRARKMLGTLNRAAADGNTWASTWILTHHPRYRDTFSDAAAERRAVQRSQERTVQAIEAATTLSPEQKHELMLRLASVGEHPDPGSIG